MKQRRTFSPEFKAQVVLEVLSGAKTQAEACREYQLKPELLSKWKAYNVSNFRGAVQFSGVRNDLPRYFRSRVASSIGSALSAWRASQQHG